MVSQAWSASILAIHRPKKGVSHLISQPGPVLDTSWVCSKFFYTQYILINIMRINIISYLEQKMPNISEYYLTKN